MLALAVITKERYAEIELVFESEPEMKLFVTGLQVLIKEVKGNTNLKDYKEMKLRQLWSASDKNADGNLDKKEIRKLLETINHEVST